MESPFMSKVKNFVIDTNVILYSPNCLETFEDNNIYIPAVVLEEVDSFKKNVDLNGYNARQFIRKIEEYRCQGKLTEGVKLDSGGMLYVVFTDYETARNLMPIGFDYKKNDNLILSAAKDLNNNGKETVVISKDVNLRIKANVLGMASEDYYHEQMGSYLDERDDVLYVSDAYIDQIYKFKELDVPQITNPTDDEEWQFSPKINEYFLLKSEVDDKKGALVKHVTINEDSGQFKLVDIPDDILGIKAANRKQVYLMDALLDSDIDIVFAIGIAGTGKTLLALCAGLFSVLNDNYKRLVITRSPIPMGRDIGYLPGGVNEKMDPWLKPIYDNMEFIISTMGKEMSSSSDEYLSRSQMHDITIEYLKQTKTLEIEALTYIRGRTLMDTYIVIDEAQNLSPHEMKTIITRAGTNTKIVFTGDLKQIDNPYLNERDNGLINASEKFMHSGFKHAATIYLDKGERSRLASEAAEVL